VEDEKSRSLFSASGILRARSFTLERLAGPTIRAWEGIARQTLDLTAQTS